MKFSLNELQQAFIDGLLNKNDDILRIIKAPKDCCVKKRFAVYQNSIFASRQKILKNIYPVCQKLVGIDFFNYMANQYFHPGSQSLNEYGRDFPEFMQDFEPLQSLPYLPDVARFEWAFHASFTDADVKITKEELQEESILGLNTGSYLLFSRYPVYRIWEMNQSDASQNEILEIIEANHYYLIVRQHFDRKIITLNNEDWQILHWLRQKISFRNLCHQMIDTFPDINILEKLTYFFKKGLIAIHAKCYSYPFASFSKTPI